MSDGILSTSMTRPTKPNKMTDEIAKPTSQGGECRQDRLKSALRENLKRRKLQARERSKTTESSDHDEASAGKTRR